MMGECSISALRTKEVLRLSDAAVLGYVTDVLFDACSGQITALCVVPPFGFCVRRRKRRILAWRCVRCIGETAIIVDAEDTQDL